MSFDCWISITDHHGIDGITVGLKNNYFTSELESPIEFAWKIAEVVGVLVGQAINKNPIEGWSDDGKRFHFPFRIQGSQDSDFISLNTKGNPNEIRPSDSVTFEPRQNVNLKDRPKIWHCIYCGFKNDKSYNDYICENCKKIRVFMGGSMTVVQCWECKQLNPAISIYCEWCGNRISDNVIQ